MGNYDYEWKVELDMKRFTLDGQPIQSEDIVLLLSRYVNMHQEDEHAWNVLCYWCYGRDTLPLKDLNQQRKRKGLEP